MLTRNGTSFYDGQVKRKSLLKRPTFPENDFVRFSRNHQFRLCYDNDAYWRIFNLLRAESNVFVPNVLYLCANSEQVENLSDASVGYTKQIRVNYYVEISSHYTKYVQVNVIMNWLLYTGLYYFFNMLVIIE